MQSRMFLQNISVIDHAYMTDYATLMGESVNLCVEIEGKIDEEEQVVIDFSRCKKDIKSLVDDSVHAIDHRLVVVDGWSNAVVSSKGIKNMNMAISSSVNDWYQVIPNVTGDYLTSLQSYLETMLLEQLQKLGHPVTVVKVHLSTMFDIPMFVNASIRFHYVHGLRSSSSYGCQNIAHGHRSFVGVDAESDEINDILTDIHLNMSGILAWDENYNSSHNISYTSGRGDFEMELSNDIRVRVLETETTVENLTQHIADTWGELLKKAGATRLWVSEGLSKGAVIEL